MQLVFYPDPILRRRAAPVLAVDEAVKENVRHMIEIMYRERGVGLAAPQVGWSARLFVLNLRGEEDRSGEKVYINPEVLLPESETEESVDEEGCLSIPGVRGKVARHRHVVVRARDLEGNTSEEEVTDLHARVIQHEIDHLDGILFISRLNTSERMLAGKTLKKLEKEYRDSLKDA